VQYGDVVRSLLVSGTNLYAGGSFVSIGGVSANRVAKWDGTAWSALGSGLTKIIDGFSYYMNVNSVAMLGTNLYAAGDFTHAGGNPAHLIAKWDGTAWWPVGPGLPDPFGYANLNALASSGTNLIVGGSFSVANGSAANGIILWNGTNWSPFGSGVGGAVNALAVSANGLFAGGDFTTAGGKISVSVARAFLNGVPPLEYANGRATVFFRIPAGKYRIDRSTNLSTWQVLASRYAGATGGIDFLDENAPQPSAFYRAVPQQP
jgi:hypothetical protein